MHAGEWLHLKRQPFEDREEIVVLCADGEQVASVAEEDLWKYDGILETSATFVCAGQLVPFGPHRLTVSVRLLGYLLLMKGCASPHVLQDWTSHRTRMPAALFDLQICTHVQTSCFASASAQRVSKYRVCTCLGLDTPPP